ncbi:HDL328Wp [Eremothecium sinecaudum]|uniref:Protein yippee-like n=1 Tax=Eremothecium sinecaudum TaxID=45286 RepID=A0A120K249_9SACH|nr:HDL328Wp [Eremothecium sinecaudum]AMD20416.1 HDL328Wp [Eremothecium sinecaudum]
MAIGYSVYIERPSEDYIGIKNKRTNLAIYGCNYCKTHLSSSNHIMSKDYCGKTGDAYLMRKVINVTEGRRETRCMITGRYVVCDIYCHTCKNLVGWKYLMSEKRDQEYKEGKYILELEPITECQ